MCLWLCVKCFVMSLKGVTEKQYHTAWPWPSCVFKLEAAIISSAARRAVQSGLNSPEQRSYVLLIKRDENYLGGLPSSL